LVAVDFGCAMESKANSVIINNKRYFFMWFILETNHNVGVSETRIYPKDGIKK
jgi:hypothetical protein